MTFMIKDGGVLKTDSSGRLRTPHDRRETILNEFDSSGLSGVKFAQLVGIKYPTFASWIRNRRRIQKDIPDQKQGKQKSTRWLEAVVEKRQDRHSSEQGILLRFAGGAEVEIVNCHQARLAAELIASLERKAVTRC
jgi:hypothetical protein